MPISGIIFDFGNVIARFDHMRSCERLSVFTPYSPADVYHRIFNSELIKRYDQGELSSYEFYAAVVEKLAANAQLTFGVFRPLWSDIFLENPGFDTFVGTIDHRVRKIILSNTNEMHFERIAELPAMKTHFVSPDSLVLSFRQGMTKPDRRIFAEAIRRCGSPIEQTVFIDDIPDHVGAFKGLGGHGIVYNCQTDPLPVLVEALSQCGLRLPPPVAEPRIATKRDPCNSM